MKKSIAVITAVIVLSVSGLVFAEMNDKGKEMMKDKAGMMGMMNKPSMVAVGDGVVVLSGKKLYKYDANLNLVKEANVKVEEMGDGKMCPMCQMMKDKGMGMMDKASDDKDKGSEAQKPAEDHAAHH